jgi:hypothetical protein
MERKNIFSIDQDLLSLYLNNQDNSNHFGVFHDEESDKDLNLNYGLGHGGFMGYDGLMNPPLIDDGLRHAGVAGSGSGDLLAGMGATRPFGVNSGSGIVGMG